MPLSSGEVSSHDFTLHNFFLSTLHLCHLEDYIKSFKELIFMTCAHVHVAITLYIFF